jgi:NADPH2:quinone reductase
MKQIFVTRFGGPEVLELREVAVPEPGPGEVRVKVAAAGINYADIMQRDGLYPNGPQPPFGAGFEVAGVIDAADPNVVGWKVGDAVMAFCQNGYSEYVTAPAAMLLPKPAELSFEQASAIPCQYLTAYHALLTLGRLKAGQTVLVHAAAGGLGSIMVQIAHNVGATVIGTCSSAEKCALIRDLGCDFPINYAVEEFGARVREITAGKGCDLIIESVGGDILERSLRCLKPRGMLVTLGVASKNVPSVSSVELLANNWTVAGFHLMGYTADMEAMGHALADLKEWLAGGKLTVIVRHTFPLDQAAEAHRQISDRKTVGKVVLTTG